MEYKIRSTTSLKVSWIGSFVNNLFLLEEETERRLQSKKIEMQVKHVFHNTIYLRHAKHDHMIIISKYDNRAPYIINIQGRSPSFDKILGANSLAVANLTDKTLAIYDGRRQTPVIVLDYGNAPVYKQKKLLIKTGPYLKERVRKALFVLEVLFTTLKDDWYKEYEYIKRILEEKPLEETPWYLLGRGSGFTPAGDDVLQGIVLALKQLSTNGSTDRNLPDEVRVKEFFEELEKLVSMGKTTWASSHYIRFALMGYYDEDALSLLNAVASASGDYIDYIMKLGRRGHNSGLFMALGLMWGIYYMLNIIK